jgi:hypothetical protein
VRRTVALLGLLGVVPGCTDDIVPASTIERTRVIGARVEVDGDPAVAQPAPGDRATVRFFVVDAAEPVPVSWALVACPASLNTRGATFCAGMPAGVSFVETPGTERPSIDVAVPPAAALGDAREILIAGIVCGGGRPVFDMMEMEGGCEGDGVSETLVTLTVPIALGGAAPNRNPSIDGLVVRLSDRALELAPVADPAALPLTDCTTTPGVTVVPRDDGDVTLATTGLDAEREDYVDADGMPREERFLMSTFNDGTSELEQQFAFFDEANLMDETELLLPKARNLAPGGTLVRLHFVVRDQRGGIAMTSRAVCVTP